VQDDGCTLRSHLEVIQRTTGITPEDLAPLPYPHELHYLLEYFWKISIKRQNGMGANSLTSSEILAWQTRNRIRFDPFEESVIDRLDSLFLQHQNKPRAKA
jgi:hypothetical protein